MVTVDFASHVHRDTSAHKHAGEPYDRVLQCRCYNALCCCSNRPHAAQINIILSFFGYLSCGGEFIINHFSEVGKIDQVFKAELVACEWFLTAASGDNTSNYSRPHLQVKEQNDGNQGRCIFRITVTTCICSHNNNTTRGWFQCIITDY